MLADVEMGSYGSTTIQTGNGNTGTSANDREDSKRNYSISASVLTVVLLVLVGCMFYNGVKPMAGSKIALSGESLDMYDQSRIRVMMDGNAEDMLVKEATFKVQWDASKIKDNFVNVAVHKVQLTKPMRHDRLSLLAEHVPNDGETFVSVPDLDTDDESPVFVVVEPALDHRVVAATVRTALRSKLMLYLVRSDGWLSRRSCNRWISNQPNPPTWANALPKCPSTFPYNPANPACQKIRDRFFNDPACSNGAGCQEFHAGAHNCIRGSAGSHGQQCCYATNGNLCVNAPCGGTADYSGVAPPTASWWDQISSGAAHLANDVQPYNYCCKWAGDANLCHQYMVLRPINAGLHVVHC